MKKNEILQDDFANYKLQRYKKKFIKCNCSLVNSPILFIHKLLQFVH